MSEQAQIYFNPTTHVRQCAKLTFKQNVQGHFWVVFLGIFGLGLAVLGMFAYNKLILLPQHENQLAPRSVAVEKDYIVIEELSR